MSKYLTGQEVVATLDIEVFELRELAKKGLLRPFTRSGVRVRDIQEERNLLNSKEHQLFTLTLKLGAFEVGRVEGVISPYRARGWEREKELAELKAQIARLEDEGIRPMSYEQIQEELSQYLPCIWENFDLPMNESKAIQLMRKFHKFIYLKTDVEGLRPTNLKTVNDGSISKNNDIAWADITVTVLSDVELHFQWGVENVTRRYNSLGFEDKRSGNPINAWSVLLRAAQERRIPFDFSTRKQVEKLAQTLRRKFEALFPMVKGDLVFINSAQDAYEFSFCLKPKNG